MKKIFLGFFLLGILEFHTLFGADFEIKNLEVDLYSKTSAEMKKISMDLHIFTNEVAKSSAIKDAINVIVSSFYAQDLMSSKGKEAFKEAIKKYSASKYKIKIDDVYILTLKEIDNIDIARLVKQLDKYYKNPHRQSLLYHQAYHGLLSFAFQSAHLLAFFVLLF